METKKNPKIALDNKRVIFLETGLILSLVAVLGAFSYSTSARKEFSLQADAGDVPEEEIIPIIQETPPEPPKLPEIPVFSDVLDIVDNDIKTIDVLTLESDELDVVPIRDYIEEIKDEVMDEDIPFVRVEQKPTFQGGDAKEFSRWVALHLDYPEIAREMGLSGRVTVEFTVRKDGKIANVKVLQGVDPILDKEAVRVVTSSPLWEPGRQGARPVNVTYQFPVIFRLR